MNWQYKTISLPSLVIDREDMLSEMGLNSWELVGFEQGLAFFKRPKIEAVEPLSSKAASVGSVITGKAIGVDFGTSNYPSQFQYSKKRSLS